MCHVLLVAGLKNPTVRRRYLAVRELLVEYGYSNFYEILLEALGCARMNRTDVECHLARLADLGIASPFDLQQRVEQIKKLLPQLWSIAEVIISANSEVEN